MTDITSLFGNHAGTIWRVLHDHGPLSESALLHQTNLTEPQLYAAVGWLARENKIHIENKTYTLGETNLADSVGKDAGKVWKALNIWGQVDAQSLCHLARIPEPEVYAAAGWLAREGKINGRLKNIDEKKILFWLK